MSMRTCEEYEDMISSLLDGVLTEDEHAGLTAHIADCPSCREYLEQQTIIHNALVLIAEEEVEMPENFTENVMNRVRFTPQKRTERTEKKDFSRWQRWRRWAALAACCAIAAAGLWTGWTAGRSGSSSGGSDNAAPQMGISMDAAPSEGYDTGGAAADGYGCRDAAAETEEAAEDKAFHAETPGAAPSPDSPDSPAAPAGGASAPETAVSGDSDSVFENFTPTADKTFYQNILTTSSPLAGAWLEENLGLDWMTGEQYELTAEEYARLREILTAAGEDFTEEINPEGSNGFLLAAGNGAGME